MTDAQWRELVRAMHDVDQNLLVITMMFQNFTHRGKHRIETEGYQGRAYYPSKLFANRMPIAAEDPLEAILSEADALGMHVMPGVGNYAFFDYTPGSLRWHKQVASELWDRYGHHPSFYGWYVSGEKDGGLGEAEERQELVEFFREFTTYAHSLAPDKPVMLAPNCFHLRGAEAAYRKLLPQLDILCPFGFHRMPPGNLHGEEAAVLMQSLCDETGCHLWMDLESFVFRNGAELHPRPIQGLVSDFTRFGNFEKTLHYQFPGLMCASSMSRKPGGEPAVVLYNDYRRFLEASAEGTTSLSPAAFWDRKGSAKGGVGTTNASGDPSLFEGGVATPWPVKRAREWYDKQPWLVGCNFLPSTAVNDVEMWQAETFDPATIDRELGWARDLGFNTVRVFLNYVVWEADAAGLKKRFGQFLRLAHRHRICVMPILFDDCNFAGRIASTGRQPDPVPGVHNSQWVSSPPAAMVTNRAAWPRLEAYVKDMVRTFGQDRRIVVWDLYNEPGNSGVGEGGQPLVEATFGWARQVKPRQPLTTGAFADFNSPSSRRMMELSDVVSFHGYDSLAGVTAKLEICAAYNRPVLCTEWLVRRDGNTFETLLPFFRDRKIACWNWGLVAGRTQTYFPWGSPKDAPEPKRWQHDVLRASGSPFNAREVRFIKVTTGILSPSALPKVLVPTAEKRPVAWRYTLAQPAEGWVGSDFDDRAWEQGSAPFGREEASIARKPNTVWSSADIWLRRTFEMPAGQFAELTLVLHHDEDTEIYVNGVLATKASGFNAAYESFDISPEAQAVLVPGTNTMAVHSHQTVGGQYIDLGIEGMPGVSR